jgi:hypothetical protein
MTILSAASRSLAQHVKSIFLFRFRSIPFDASLNRTSPSSSAGKSLRTTLIRLRQKIEIKLVVPILEKGPLAAIAALRYVMRETGQNDAGKAAMAANYPDRTVELIE